MLQSYPESATSRCSHHCFCRQSVYLRALRDVLNPTSVFVCCSNSDLQYQSAGSLPVQFDTFKAEAEYSQKGPNSQGLAPYITAACSVIPCKNQWETVQFRHPTVNRSGNCFRKTCTLGFTINALRFGHEICEDVDRPSETAQTFPCPLPAAASVSPLAPTLVGLLALFCRACSGAWASGCCAACYVTSSTLHLQQLKAPPLECLAARNSAAHASKGL